MSLPANVSLDKIGADVSTQTKSGTKVLFKIEPIKAAILVLQNEQGDPLRLGTQVLLNRKYSTMVAYDGIVYLENLEGTNYLEINNDQSSCSIEFEFKSEEATIPQLGPFVCM